MPFIRTKQATDWSKHKPTIAKRFFRFALRSIEANPDYTAKLYLVSEWLIEFDDEGLPEREIGIDKDGLPVLAGPDSRNYGFWLDANMTISDFTGELINQEEFERYWKTVNAISKTAT